MARALKSLAVMIPAFHTTSAATPACIKFGMEYTGTEVSLAGYVRSWSDCQTQCAFTVYCDYFTWKAKGDAAKNLGPGSCQKFGSAATLAAVADAEANPDDTVSGPISPCVPTNHSILPDANGTAAPVVPPIAPVVPTIAPLPESTAAPASTEAPAVTVPPVPTLPPTVAPPVLPTGIPTLVPGSKEANTTNGTLVGPGAGMGGETSGGSGLPWWAMLLIALIVVGVAAGVILMMCGGGKKKKSKTDKKVKKAKKEAVDTEAQALVRAEAPPPVAEPLAAAAPVATGAPLPQMSGIQMASPVATGGIPQPAFGSGSQMFNSQGQVVYVQQPQAVPIQTGQMSQMQPMMMQPQFR